MVILRDGRKLVGTLRTYDQHSNLVFQDTIERIVAGGRYFADIPRGIFVVRGDNLVFLGEFADGAGTAGSMIEGDVASVLQMQRQELERKQRLDQLRERVFIENGFGKEMETEQY